MGEDGNNLIESNSREPFEKFIDCCPGFKVLKKSTDRNAGVTKNPGAAEYVFAKPQSSMPNMICFSSGASNTESESALAWFK
jgi:hypothetical protein